MVSAVDRKRDAARRAGLGTTWRATATSTYVGSKDSDFVVIMKKYRDGRRRLITSYYVDKDYKRQDFERKYANRLQ